MAEKITAEIISESRNYFKENKDGKLVKTPNYDMKNVYREYGVKTLQAYIQEIEDLRKNPNYEVEEIYTKDGAEIKLDSLLSGSGLTAMLGLLSREVKQAEISRYYDIATGGLLVKAFVQFKIDLF